MITCPKCSELNGADASKCFKCGTSLESGSNYRKMCPKCQSIFSSKAEICDKCGICLSVLNSREITNNKIDYKWVYVVSLLIPLVGIIMGAIFATSGDFDKARTGKSLIIFSIAAMIAFAFIFSLAT